MNLKKVIYVIIFFTAFHTYSIIVGDLSTQTNFEDKELAKYWFEKYFQARHHEHDFYLLNDMVKNLITEYIIYNYYQTKNNDYLNNKGRILSKQLENFFENNFKERTEVYKAFKELEDMKHNINLLLYLYNNLIIHNIKHPIFTFSSPNQVWFGEKFPSKLK